MSGARRLVVVGDSLLDREVDGQVRRLCPDAPAPVLDELSSVDRPGGAGLAALLAAGQGYEVCLVTAIAEDAAGARLTGLLAASGIQVYPLRAPGRTPEKIRMRGAGQVLMRLDRGGDGPGEPAAPGPAVLDLLRTATVVLASDYGRGLLRCERLREALSATAAPVVWDPHPRGPAAVPSTRLVTPNESELHSLVAGGPQAPRLPAAARGAAELRERWRASAVAVTMGGDGALLCHAGPTPLVVPTPMRAEGDSCGAGDRFAGAVAVALAGGALVSEAVQVAVEQAAAYVAAGGARAVQVPPAQPATAVPAAHSATAVPAAQSATAVPPARVATAPLAPPGGAVGADATGALIARVRARGGTVVATGGCFDLLHAGHLATLQAARQLGDCLVVCLNSDSSVTGLKGPSRPLVGQADRARLLAALGCVDAVVVFDEPTPQAVLSWLRPDVWVKGGDYSDGLSDSDSDRPTLPEAELVRRWGGQTVVVPYLDGRSTSGMIAEAGRRLRAGAAYPHRHNGYHSEGK